CTEDRCTPEGCVNTPLAGFAALRCVVDSRVATDACGDLPRRIQRRVDRARGLVERAEGVGPIRSRRLLHRAANALGSAAVGVQRAPRLAEISRPCADAVGAPLAAGAKRLTPGP